MQQITRVMVTAQMHSELRKRWGDLCEPISIHSREQTAGGPQNDGFEKR